MGELHAAGRTAEDVRACLRAAPLSPHAAAAIRAAHARGCELRVLSDANAFFIDAVLAHHGLAGYFSGTDTNPASVEAAGRLRIRPYHEFAAPAAGHGCALPSCPPNMCKVHTVPGRPTSCLPASCSFIAGSPELRRPSLTPTID